LFGGCLARLSPPSGNDVCMRNRTHEECSSLRPHAKRRSRTSPQTPLAKTAAQADGSVLPQGGPSKEAATPTSPRHAMKAYALNTPWETLRQFTLENRRKRQLGRNPTALSRHLTFAMALLCPKPKAPATRNSSRAVHKLWRTEVLCGKPRKNGSKSPPRAKSRMHHRFTGSAPPRSSCRWKKFIAFSSRPNAPV